MNLAFLGYYSKNILYPKKHLISLARWYIYKKISKYKKIPGRDNNTKI